MQDAFADAITAWQRDGIPANPGAWITVAARRRAIDRLRRDRSIADRAVRLAELARLGAREDAGAGGDEMIVLMQSGRADPGVHRFYEALGFEPGLRIAYAANWPAQQC